MDATGFLTTNAALLIVFGVIVGIVLAGSSMAVPADKKTRKNALKAGALVVGGVMVFSGVAGLVMAPPSDGGQVCDAGETLVDGRCVVIPALTWTWQVPSTEAHAQHDIETEYPDSPLTANDAGTPDLNLEACVWDTDSFWDSNTKRAKTIITVDDDQAVTPVAPATVDYQDPDSCIMDVLFQPSYLDLNNDGEQDHIPYYVRLRSISPGTTIQYSANNATQAAGIPAFYRDGVGGWYVYAGLELDAPSWAHENADHAYKSLCAPGDPGYSIDSLTAQCYSRWLPAGVYDDDDPDAIAIGWSSSNSLFGYLTPDNAANFEMIWDIGTPTSYFSIPWTISVGVVD